MNDVGHVFGDALCPLNVRKSRLPFMSLQEIYLSFQSMEKRRSDLLFKDYGNEAQPSRWRHFFDAPGGCLHLPPFRI